ncbi:MAG: alanine racemase [Firmicutes bacterium]|nr:alanine racemase [Bacillota bacterium]
MELFKKYEDLQLRDTIVKVDLSAIAENMRLIREMCGPDVAIMPVIKANGYGHGAVGIAPTLMESGATYLAVATLTEALELREAYPDYPIFILGHTPDRLMDIVVEQNFIQTLADLSQAKSLSAAAVRAGKTVKAHLKCDTGFHRLGIYDEDELYEMTQQPGLDVEGIFSHLALTNDEENLKQYNLLVSMIEKLEARGCTFKFKHIADSISLVDYPEYRMNMVRPGALIFGLRGFHIGTLDVKQCITFESRITQVHHVKAGEGVGYDYLWRAPQDTRVGTMPFGYADGYPRNMRDKGYVTIDGIKCPILGVICMDQVVVDLTEVPQATEGTVGIIYGDGTNNTMSIQEASELAGSNKNEIVARILARPPRVYVK